MSRMGGWEYEPDSQHLVWSPELYEIYGLPPEVQPSRELTTRMLAPDDYEQVRHAARRALDNAIPFDLEVPMETYAGREIWVRIMGQPHVRDGEVVRLTGVIQDITDHKEAERLRREFLSTVSHELRTPLTSIRGALGLLTQKADDEFGEKTEKLIRVAHRNGQRLARIIDDVLNAEKLEAGKVSVEPEFASPSMIASEVVEANRSYAEACNVAIELNHANGDELIWVDPSRLEQVLANLVSNAIKLSPPGETVVLGVEPAPEPGKLRFAVADRGPGIDGDLRERLFERFIQGPRSAGSNIGTGLGLNIAKELTEAMGGEIGFSERPEGGSTFYVDFPSYSPDDAVR